MAFSAQEIQRHAKHIRDTLSPLISAAGGAALRRSDFGSLLDFFTKLEKTNVSPEILQQSRIDKALLEICATGTRWPAILVERAEHILRRWETKIGKVGEHRAALWANGGRMAGCYKRVTAEKTTIPAEDGKIVDDGLKLRKTWVVDPTGGWKVERYGEVNLKVGR